MTKLVVTPDDDFPQENTPFLFSGVGIVDGRSAGREETWAAVELSGISTGGSVVCWEEDAAAEAVFDDSMGDEVVSVIKSVDNWESSTWYIEDMVGQVQPLEMVECVGSEVGDESPLLIFVEELSSVEEEVDVTVSLLVAADEALTLVDASISFTVSRSLSAKSGSS